MAKFLRLFLPLALAGCAPNLPAPTNNITVSAYTKTPLTNAVALTASPPAEWWRGFNNAALNQLVATGLANSPTITEASANLSAAAFAATAATGAYLPQLSLNPNLSRAAYPTGPNAFPPYTIYALTGTISYDPGLFGARKFTWQNGAALTAYQQAELDAARQSVAGNITAAAITLAGDNAQIATTQSIIAAEQKLFSLLQGEYADGAIPQLSLLQQQSQILATQATLPALQTEADTQTNRLAILTGQLPAAFSPPPITLDSLTPPSPIPLAIPSTYLANRPDLRAARATIAAQNAELGLAIAHMYPDLTLTAQGGYAAATLGTLFQPASALWSLAGNLLQPIYAGDTLHARKQAAQAQLTAALAAYQSAILAAFAEAADTLQAVQNDQIALTRATEAATTATAAYHLAAQQFALGATDYTTVLTAQTTATQQALILAQTRTTLMLDTARLEAATVPVAGP
jgi:NodT family efflux transporter outer membrane factor (OMF) lipoprotein